MFHGILLKYFMEFIPTLEKYEHFIEFGCKQLLEKANAIVDTKTIFIIFSSFKEHLAYLKQNLNSLQSTGFNLNLSKFYIPCNEIQ